MQSLTIIVTLFLLDLCYQVTTSAAIDVSIARALPITDIALNAAPILTVQSGMKLHCLRECTRYSCLSFNFGMNTCEMFDTYVCEDVGVLEARPGFRHYDVLNGSLLQFVDSYIHLTDCTVHGRCSPKCYLSTTSSTSTTTTPTTSTSTTTSTTAVTTLAPTTSTNPPTTTTTSATTTTTTAAPTTSTTTATPITPITCSTNAQCTVANSNCRNGVVCECEAGFSFHPASGTCVTSCPSGYGNSFHKTADKYLFSLDMTTIPNSSPAACQSQCAADNSCASFEIDSLLGDCTLSSSTKYGNEAFWFSDMFLDYYQRDCA